MLRPGTLPSFLARLTADSLRHPPPAQNACGDSLQVERTGRKTGFVSYGRVPASRSRTSCNPSAWSLRDGQCLDEAWRLPPMSSCQTTRQPLRG